MNSAQIRYEIQIKLDKLCPDLHMNVIQAQSQLTVSLGVVHMLFTLPIDDMEWIKNSSDQAKTNLVKHRLLEMLTNASDEFSKQIERIKQI